MTRKIKRNIQKRKAKEAKEKMAETVGLFNKIPDHCLACKTPFDKTNKDMVFKWRVTVDTAAEKVKLYCPQCWAIAQQIIEDNDL